MRCVDGDERVKGENDEMESICVEGQRSLNADGYIDGDVISSL